MIISSKYVGRSVINYGVTRFDAKGDFWYLEDKDGGRIEKGEDF